MKYDIAGPYCRLQVDLMLAIRSSIFLLYSSVPTSDSAPAVPVMAPTTIVVGSANFRPMATWVALSTFSAWRSWMSARAVAQLMG